MNLALNYSPQAADLLREGTIQLDLLKCPDWPELIREAEALKPVYVHFPLVVGSPSLRETDWGEVEAFLTETQTAFVNVHLEATPTTYPGVPVNTRDPHHAERLTERFIEDVALVASHFGAERVVAENVIYRGHRGNLLRPAALGEVIRTVVQETGCGFLLDLSHARISVHYLGVEEPGVELWGYLDALPVERLRELHVTGIHYLNDKLTDHLPLTEEDWEITGKVFERIRTGTWAEPIVVAFEYGGVGPTFAWRSDKGVIAEQVPRLYGLVHSVVHRGVPSSP